MKRKTGRTIHPTYPHDLRPVGGMTLRDYFAGQTLAGLLADHEVTDSPENLAEVAYAMADAMLKAREEV